MWYITLFSQNLHFWVHFLLPSKQNFKFGINVVLPYIELLTLELILIYMGLS
jgi:hypothetical protein